jgi:hypothetical protein
VTKGYCKEAESSYQFYLIPPDPSTQPGRNLITLYQTINWPLTCWVLFRQLSLPFQAGFSSCTNGDDQPCTKSAVGNGSKSVGGEITLIIAMPLKNNRISKQAKNFSSAPNDNRLVRSPFPRSGWPCVLANGAALCASSASPASNLRPPCTEV